MVAFPNVQARSSLVVSVQVPEHVDDNTVGVVCIMGSTYNGQLEDIKALDTVIGMLLPHSHPPCLQKSTESLNGYKHRLVQSQV